MKKFKFKLGDKVKSKIMGYTGVITGRVQYITGSDRYLVQGKCEDNNYEKPHWFDEGGLTKIE